MEWLIPIYLYELVAKGNVQKNVQREERGITENV